MKPKKIIFIIIIILSLILSGLLLIYKKYNFKKKFDDSTKNQKMSAIKVDKFYLQQIFKNKNNKWILKANSGKIFTDQNKANCEKTKATFIQNNTKIATLHAPKTTFYLKENKIKMTGGIKSKILNNSTSNNRID